ncbi:hypothetical protein EC973_008011 [Apophysomyces ossiformis]|uniref:RING-type domain-containing protein n=1 Tax=Apophysomyces ossiformis TaxID=679940 RepID=A0A8H7BR91_9FUNG|nr:hypothetical protein EC973_008011 [Apophysomyces ossiformis]
MPRHSKNNTASSVFTYHEAKSLDYGTKRQRIGRDSFREYNACFLCLQTARDPVACSHGHLACRECMYEFILTQKQNIKREQRQLELKLLELKEKKLQSAEEARQALLDEFEKTQTSMLGNRKSFKEEKNSLNKSEPKSDRGSIASITSDSASSSKKRKFELTEEEIAANNEKDVEKASQKLAEEKAEASKAKLASFWLPTLTPEAQVQGKDEIKAVQPQPMCTASKEAHAISIKSLIEIKFQTEDGKKDKNVCPACLKSLSNAIKFSVMRNCGHVICNACTDMFVKKSKKCYVCEKKTKSKDIVDMSAEGTGFVGGSTAAMAEKWGLAFQ